MRTLAVTGGVGGAKLCLGLAHELPPEDALFVVNTGDDFRHLGLTICPDIDTLTYTLADEANPDTGWGRRDETWQFMDALRSLGGPDWFNLGDRDLAIHVLRTDRLAGGATLTEVTADIHARFGIRHRCVPMSDDPVSTVVATTDGELAFQHYFVRDRCEPAVTGFRFDGIERARPNPAIRAWLEQQPPEAILICPSNPFVSVDPVLAVPGLLDALRASGAPLIAVTPIIAGEAIKGPTAKMMAELDMPGSATAVASHYAGRIDGFVLDSADADQQADIEALGLSVHVTNTWMRSLQDRRQLARDCLTFARRLGRH